MRKTVIIAEKHSVAKAIAKIVGSNEPHYSGPTGYIGGGEYDVTWAAGHLVGLMSPEQMGFTNGELPMFPRQWMTKINSRKDKEGKEETDAMASRQMQVIESLFFSSDEIIVATDAGREGELIFRYIYEYLNCRKPFRRLWISSLTDEAISEGMHNLRPGYEYENLSREAHSRSQADWLVGFNGSRALRLATGFKANISLGRVQTPTLGMICERYEQNKNFIPTPYWQIKTDTEKDGTPFQVWTEHHYSNEGNANSDLAKVKKACQLRVDKVEEKQSTTKPPLLYDLTALQRAANGKYGITASNTMATAQSLYEKKYISYPRTGSRFIPEDVFKTIPALLSRLEEYERFGSHAAALSGKRLCRRSVNNEKVADHHALLPTGNIPSNLTPYEEKIYDMIVGRTIEAFGEDHKADVTTVWLSANDIVFKTRGSIPAYMGWRAVFGPDAVTEGVKKDSEEYDSRSPLPKMMTGDLLPINDAVVERKTDKPLPIYTDSTLLGEMETCGKRIEDEELREAMKDVGLGTPATRSAIIERLIQTNYITRDGKKLIPTALGQQIWSMVKGRKISDIKTTGEWENRLGKIEKGELDAGVFDRGIEAFVMDIIDDLMKNCKPIEGITTSGEPIRKCPLCGNPMKNMLYSITCDQNAGGCGFRINRTILDKKLPDKAINDLIQGKDTDMIGDFTSKTGRKFSARLTIDKEKRALAFLIPKAPEMNTEGMNCPQCRKPLILNGNALTCGCGFTLWRNICGVPLSEKGIKGLLEGSHVIIRNMKGKSGKNFSAECSLDMRSGKINFEKFL